MSGLYVCNAGIASIQVIQKAVDLAVGKFTVRGIVHAEFPFEFLRGFGHEDNPAGQHEGQANDAGQHHTGQAYRQQHDPYIAGHLFNPGFEAFP